jgi:hypothetical protein
VTGESRGRLWRTKLAKTAAGYVAKTELFARLGLLAVDCAISPEGDLLVSCHTGKPDWGNGPEGAGRLFKISLADKAAPQPVTAWAASETETVLAFDRPLDEASWHEMAARTKISSGRFVDAGDRYETIRPGYAVVQLQQKEKPIDVAVKSARLSDDRRNVLFETAPRMMAVNYAFTIGGSAGSALDVMQDLTGVAAEWRSSDGAASSKVWLPHPDLVAAREFTRGSAIHDAFWKNLTAAGTLTLRGQLDLWKMLIPVTQPGSDLGYIPEPEVVTVTFKSDAALSLYIPGIKADQVSEREARFTVTPTSEGKFVPFVLNVQTPAASLEVSFQTTRDSRPRALGIRRCSFHLPGPHCHRRIPYRHRKSPGATGTQGMRCSLEKQPVPHVIDCVAKGSRWVRSWGIWCTATMRACLPTSRIPAPQSIRMPQAIRLHSERHLRSSAPESPRPPKNYKSPNPAALSQS